MVSGEAPCTRKGWLAGKRPARAIRLKKAGKRPARAIRLKKAGNAMIRNQTIILIIN